MHKLALALLFLGTVFTFEAQAQLRRGIFGGRSTTYNGTSGSYGYGPGRYSTSSADTPSGSYTVPFHHYGSGHVGRVASSNGTVTYAYIGSNGKFTFLTVLPHGGFSMH